MPWVLGMCGFGARNTTRDRITVVSGTGSYSTTTLPPDSPSTTSFTAASAVTVRRPFYHGDSVIEPSTGAWGCHARYQTNSNLGTSGQTALQLGMGRSGSELVTLSAAVSTNAITLRVSGSVVATAVSATWNTGSFDRVHMIASGNALGDTIKVYLNGNLAVPVLTYTLTGGIAKPNELWAKTKNSVGDFFDDLFAWDPADPDYVGDAFLIEMGIKEQVFTGDGAESDWSGSFTDIDERPNSDADKITAGAVGDVSSFTKPAVGEDNVYAVTVNARVTRTGTAAGANLTVRANDGVSASDVTAAAPGDGDVTAVFDAAPDGLPWSSVKYDATRIAFVAVT